MTKAIYQPQSFPLALTFDDILILPGYADFSREEISLESKLTRELTLKLPLVSAPMDTVTESELAIALGELGGLGIVHRNLTLEDQVAEVKKVVAQKVLVGAAIGANTGYQERAQALVEAGANLIVVDSAHGFSKSIIEAVKYLKKTWPDLQVMAGNIATYEGALALIEAGADSLRVGMGPGAICTTRVVSGMGVPQVSALLETIRAARPAGVPVVADGGIKYSGDMVKALATGAGSVMMGSYFASASESPGEKVELPAELVPAKFSHLLKQKADSYLFKTYRGMGSVGAMEKGAKIKSEDEFHGKSYKEKVLVAEGVEGLVPVKGTVKEIVEQAVGGIKSGLYYIGARTLDELYAKAQFVQITPASLGESHPHDLVITNAGKNY
jgi:IMP dehydrogenase